MEDSPKKLAQGNCCPLKATDAERKIIIKNWLDQIPDEVLSSVRGLKVVKRCLGFKIAGFSTDLNPPQTFDEVIYWLAGNAPNFNIGMMVFEDGQKLKFTRHEFIRSDHE